MMPTPRGAASTGNSIRDVIDRAAACLSPASETARLDAEVLLAHVLGRSRAWVLARANDPLSAAAASQFASLAERRRQGWPVAYLTGRREFWSREFIVTPDVLIPRPETELVVEAALSRLPAGRRGRVADLGTGSGAIAVTIALERPDLTVIATDISAAAIEIARANAVALGGTHVEFRLGDWCDVFPHGETCDVIVSNPPYVQAGDPHLDQGDLRFEPGLALAAGEIGLEAIETISDRARAHLVRGGWLVLEHGFDQAESVAALLRRFGYRDIESSIDIAGHPRVIAARYDGGAGP